MTTHVERSIEVEVPVRTAYDQWTQFEEFPRFMSGVQEVRQIGEALTHWVAEIAGIRREWDAAILEQVPDQKVAWAATTGATNAGAVYFQAVGEGRTQVRLTLDYEPEGIVERVADVLDVVQRQAVADLDRFKEFIEQQGSASGGWRGRVDDGDVQGGAAGTTGATAAAASGGDPAAGVPGDVVAVGPTGGTHGTLDTEGGTPAPASAYLDDESGVGHSGDPVAVDPAPATAPASAYLDDGLGVGHSGDPVAVDPAPATAPASAHLDDESGVGHSDPVAVDPAPATAPASAYLDDEFGVGHGGDPVAVDPAHATSTADTGMASSEPGSVAGSQRPADPDAPDSGSGDAGDPIFVEPEPEPVTGRTGSAGTGTATGDVEDAGAVNPAYATPSDTPGGGTGTAGPATSAAGVAGVGTDTGMRSDDPRSGALTGDPEAGTTEGAMMNDSQRAGGDAGDAAGFEESQAGFGESERVAAGRGVADEGEVLERDFANRELVKDDVQRDFANRDITTQDVAHKGVSTGMGGARTGTSAREGMEGDTGFQGTESAPDPERTDS